MDALFETLLTYRIHLYEESYDLLEKVVTLKVTKEDFNNQSQSFDYEDETITMIARKLKKFLKKKDLDLWFYSSYLEW